MSAIENASWALRGSYWKLKNRLGLVPAYDTEADQALDRIAPFDEYPSCELCGEEDTSEFMVARDGSRLVSCRSCDLVFTSPRIDEAVWTDWLKGEGNARNVEFTENRLKYGVALSSNVKFTVPGWFRRRMERDKRILKTVQEHLDFPLERIHDVGCGVGFLLRAAGELGLDASGNELNAYACKVMRERFGLTVYNASFPEVDLPAESLDAVVMNDYIEHTYHPKADLERAFALLRPGGAVYVHTFRIDCPQFRTHGRDWNFLFWNHVYHFSTETLSRLLTACEFRIVDVTKAENGPLITIVARKPGAGARRSGEA